METIISSERKKFMNDIIEYQKKVEELFQKQQEHPCFTNRVNHFVACQQMINALEYAKSL